MDVYQMICCELVAHCYKVLYKIIFVDMNFCAPTETS